MLGIRNICDAPDEATAQAILANSRDEWTQRSGNYHWVYADSLLGALDAYHSDWSVESNGDFPYCSVDNWHRQVSNVSWRPQMVREFQQLDQGTIPDTVGVQPWLLEFAIRSERLELVRTLLDQGVEVKTKHLRDASCSTNDPAVLCLLLSKATIEKKALGRLTCKDVLPYALPYLSDFATILAEHCPVCQLKDLKENGIDISDHNNMIRALNASYPTLETTLYLRDNTDTSPDVIEIARESAWYWVLYASDDERQAVLEQSGAWQPLIELMFRTGPVFFTPHNPIQAWHDNNEWVLADLIHLPAGIVRSIFRSSSGRAFLSGPLPWSNNELRDLLERKNELVGEPWSQLF